MKKTIVLNNYKINSLIKKLVKELNELHSVEFKLHNIQSCFSKALGYKNYHDLERKLNDNLYSKIEEVEDLKKTFNDFNKDEQLKIILMIYNVKYIKSILIKEDFTLMMEAVLEIMNYYKNKNKLIINTTSLYDYVSLNNLKYIYFNDFSISDASKKKIENYLYSLSGFNKNVENCNYNMMLLSHKKNVDIANYIIEVLENLKNEDLSDINENVIRIINKIMTK